MFKVLVIDDEPIVRKGIINVINWQGLGCEIIGEAENGIEGKKIIEAHLPDIIITDINMPELDGLTMIKETLEVVPDSKIIILTGYRDFEYIQEALKLGATEYLLKPSKLEEITTAIRKSIIELEFKNKRASNLKILEAHFQKTLPILREKLLYDIIYRLRSDKKIIEEDMELYNLNFSEYIVLSIEIDLDTIGASDNYQKQLYKFGIKNSFEEILKDDYLVTEVNITQSRIAAIIQSKNSEMIQEEDIYKKVEGIQTLIKKCFDFSITVGISTIGYGWEELSEKMRECEDAIDYKLYIGDGALIIYNDIKGLASVKDEVELETFKTDIVHITRIGNKEGIQKKIDDLYRYLSKSDLSLIEIKNYYGGIISSIAEIGNRNGFAILDERSLQTNNQIQMGDQYDVVHKIFTELVLEYADKSNTINVNNISNVLKVAMNYIHDNYVETITLKDIADSTFVSTYYLSRMFKKEIGKTFVEYLNEIRVNKAKEYLRESCYKTYEVANLVGVNDPHYFSKLFKKYTGKTPTEYRNNH